MLLHEPEAEPVQNDFHSTPIFKFVSTFFTADELLFSRGSSQVFWINFLPM
jgi:hypothetical protein